MNAVQREQTQSVTQIWSSVEGRARLCTLTGGGTSATVRSHKATFSSEIVVLGVILALIQITDGCLTAIGISRFGVGAEGNLALRSLMSLMGPGVALIVVKLAALLVILALCLFVPKIRWLKHAFHGIIALYILAAIVPWSFILAAELLP